MRLSPIKVTIFSLMLMLAVTGVAYAAEQNTDGAAVVHAEMTKLPLVFIENQGQTDPAVLFQAKAEGHSIFFTRDEVVLATEKDGKPVSFSTTVAGISPDVIVAGADKQSGIANFYIGNDPKDWQTGVPTYGGVEYQNALPGIDLTYSGKEGVLKREFIVAPCADPSAILITYQGIEGLVYGPDGTLIVKTSAGELTETALVCYQVIDGKQTGVTAQYEILGPGMAGFNVGSYDKAYPLVIDPQLKYSNYLGGALNDRALGVAVDTLGYAYITGYTCSTNFPVKAAYNSIGWVANGYADVFLTKLSPDGKTLVYSTYFGGSATDVGNSIALYNTNCTVITGYTESNPFGTTAIFSTAPDIFILTFDKNGQCTLAFTYGGPGTDVGTSVAVGPGGEDIYVTGYTNSDNLDLDSSPTRLNQGYPTGAYDAFVWHFLPNNWGLQTFKYYGGTGNEYGLGIARDPVINNTTYITGWTQSTNLTVTNVTVTGYPPAIGYNSGEKDAFVAKYNNTTLYYSTYLGGSGNDEGRGIAIDNTTGYAYVTGVTYSPDFPIQDPFQPFNGPNYYTNNFGDAFITILDQTGSNFIWSTYLGGQNSDGAQSIALDANKNIYVTGYTNSIDFPVHNYLAGFGTKHAFQDVFITMIESNLTAYNFSTYYGGGLDEIGTGIAVNDTINVYVSGYTSSYDFPTFNSYKYINKFDGSKYGGWDDGFVMRLSNTATPGLPVANFTADKWGGNAPLVVNFTDTSTGAPDTWVWNFGDGQTSSLQSPSHQYNNPGNYTVTLTVSNSYGTSSVSKGPIVVGIPPGVKFTNMTSTQAIGRVLLANNTTTNVRFYLNYTQYGLMGYNFTLRSNDSYIAEFWAVTRPGWMPAYDYIFINSTLPDDNLTFAGLDFDDDIGYGATDVLLANITLKGIHENCTFINISSVNRLQNDLAINMTPLVPPDYILQVCVKNIYPVPVSMSPNMTAGKTPLDPNHDGLYEDINGDGVVNFYDVIDFFINLEWMYLNEYYEFFDFNHNGFIDFGDIITLFETSLP